MALDSYSGLKTAIQTWLARSDLAADADDVIDMFEAWVNRNLRTPQMEAEATTPGAEYLPLPADFLELRDIQWQGTPRRQLEYLTPQMSDVVDPNGTSGIPKAYTIVGDQLRLVPAPGDTTLIRIAYWQKLPPLSATQTANWLLTLFPDAYLYGCLTHGNVRIQDEASAQAVASAWQAIMAELRKSGRNQNLGSLLRVRAA